MMNRGLGSIMGYRGGGMPVARFQAGGGARSPEYLLSMLPGNWNDFNEQQKINWFNNNNVTTEELLSAGVGQADIDYMKNNGYAVRGAEAEAAEAARVEAARVEAVAADISTRFFNALRAGNRQAALRIITEGQAAFPEADLYSIAASNVSGEVSPEVLRTISRGDNNTTADDLRYYLIDEPGQIAEDISTRFYDALRAGNRQNALDAMIAAQAAFPESDIYDIAVGNIGSQLQQNPRMLRAIGGADDVVTIDELRNYLTGTQTGTDTVIDTNPEGREDLTGGAILPGPGTYSGVPQFTRQQASGFPFAPIQRGLGQLRGPAYMPGLLQGSEGFGGTGLSQDLVREGLVDYGGGIVPEGTPGAEEINRGVIRDYILNEMIPQGLSPAEVAAASPTLSLGATQQYYNQFAPQGVFSTAAPGRTVLPEDFVLQTGAYTTPVTAISPLTGLPYAEPRTTLDAGMDPYTPSTNPWVPAKVIKETREGGAIKMAEGGEAMGKLSASEAGSKFDISEFIDEQGRLVGGYSRPIRDQFGVITGYDYRPYERDVVFNPRLAEAEARGMSDEEREAARRGLIVRQGMTGVDPYAGGLAGIVAREAMMRSRPQYYSYAKGGLASVAQDLADKGRFGDTMVAHISPREAGLLKALGGSGTINPETGLPEFFSLFPKKGIKLNLGPLGNVKIGSKSSNIIQAAAALAAGDVMGLTAGQAALAYGGVRAAATGNLMEGIQAGLTAYGMGNMYEGLSGTTIGTPSGTAPIDTVQVGSGAGGLSPEASGQVLSQNVPVGSEAEFLAARPEFGQATSEALSGMATELPETTLGLGVGDPSSMSALELAETAPTAANTAWTPPVETAPPPPDYSKSFGRFVPEGAREYVPDFVLEASTPAVLGTAALGSSLIAGQQERAAAAAQQAAINRKKEERRKRFSDLYARTLGAIPARSGGLMKLAGGGMTYMEAGGTTGPTGTPRDVTGTGDGMSDSVPASIEGVQEARLADGEFVIPADVVADIGNGSSDAGSKKLYDMMDRIRMARHGTKEQPPEIKAERLMPA